MKNKLYNFAKILKIDMNEYEKAVNLWEEDNKKAIYEYLGFDDVDNEIENFEMFFYYYICENVKSYFHNYNSKGYTKGFKKLLEGIDINIDWDAFENQENDYPELLIDILMATINYELKKINKAIIGISIGEKTIIYFLVDLKNIKELKNCKTNIVIFDIKFLESIYGVIYKIEDTIENLSTYISKGDYIMETDGKYKTLFNEMVKPNILINYLTDEDKKKLKVIL